MNVYITQEQAADMFDIPTEILYVCDGKKECGNPGCSDWGNPNVCHHTSDESHALYNLHDLTAFERHPAVQGDRAAIICVEPIRG